MKKIGRDQMKKKTAIFRGIAGLSAFLLMITVTGTNLLFTYAADSPSAPAHIYAGDNTQKFTNSEWLNANATDNTNDGDNIDWYVIYAEGIYVGYKYYETRYEDLVMKKGNADSVKGSSTQSAWNYQNEVCYPFGYGLSYAVCQMKYAKSPLARLVYHVLARMKNRSERKGKPDLNILFIYNIPFRGIAKMTGGMVSMEMAEGLVMAVNGYFFRGMSKVIGGFFTNRRQNKIYKDKLK